MGSVEDVGDVEAEDVLSVGELRDRNRAGAAVDLPRAVLRESVTLRGLVVAILDLAVEVLRDQVLARERGFVERAHDARPRAAVVLEPLPPDGGGCSVREGAVGDGREALPEPGRVARRAALRVAPAVCAQA